MTQPDTEDTTVDDDSTEEGDADTAKV